MFQCQLFRKFQKIIWKHIILEIRKYYLSFSDNIEVVKISFHIYVYFLYFLFSSFFFVLKILKFLKLSINFVSHCMSSSRDYFNKK